MKTILIISTFPEYSNNSHVIESRINLNASETTAHGNIRPSAASASNGEKALYLCRVLSNTSPFRPLSALRRHRIKLHRKISEKGKVRSKSALFQHKGCRLYHYVKNTFANALNSSMCAENQIRILIRLCAKRAALILQSTAFVPGSDKLPSQKISN